MYDITYHQFYEAAVKNQDAFVTTSSGTKRRRHTKKGVSICIKLGDGNTKWVSLKDLKEAYPVQLTDYAVAAKISTDPDFS